MIGNLNGSPDFQDGKRRLKALAEPETVLEDRKAKLMTCRYTSIWEERQETGVTERRMKMTFKLSPDETGGIDMNYIFDK